jgi:hypothetical protein
VSTAIWIAILTVLSLIGGGWLLIVTRAIRGLLAREGQ